MEHGYGEPELVASPPESETAMETSEAEAGDQSLDLESDNVPCIQGPEERSEVPVPVPPFSEVSFTDSNSISTIPHVPAFQDSNTDIISDDNTKVLFEAHEKITENNDTTNTSLSTTPKSGSSTEESDIDLTAKENDTAMELDAANALVERTDKCVTELDDLDIEKGSYYWDYDLSAMEDPKCLAVTAKSEFQNAKYTRGCKWAPDGSCLLANSDDSTMRIFNFPSSFYGVQDWKSLETKDEDWSSELKVREGGLIYDFCWYPRMSSADPISSCFLTTASNGPVHLWDAFTGELRCSYLAYNQVDEVTTAYCVAFDPTGEYIYCGFDKTVRIFNISRPGRMYTERKLKNRDFASLNQTGIISCIAVSPTAPSLYACGSFRNTIGLYLEDGTVLCILDGHLGGLTHLKFSQDGTKLFSGGRKDSRLICWDIRNLGDKYQIFNRDVTTNQRIYFDTTLNDKFLVSGETNGNVLIWDLLANSEDQINGSPTRRFEASSDCLNGINLNPFIPVLAASTGQRHFQNVGDDSDDELFVESALPGRNKCDISLWKFL